MAIQTKKLQATGSTGWHYFTLTVNEDSYSIENNSSVIGWSFVLSPKHKGYDWRGWHDNVKYSVVVNGVAASGSIPDYDGVSDVVLASGNQTIAHNNDGKKSISLDFSVNSSGNTTYYLPGTASASGNMELTAIPRAAVIASAPDFTDESSPVITYSNPAGSAASSLAVYVCDNDGKAITSHYTADRAANKVTLNFTAADREKLWKAVTKGYTKAVKYCLKTTISGIDYTDYKPATLTLINATPTLSPVVYATDELTKTLTGDANGNTLILGCSDVYVGYGQQAYKGATVEKYYCRNGSQRLDGVSYGNINNVDSGEFVFSIVDSRENTAEKTLNKNNIAYISPSCSLTATIELDGETTSKIKLSVKGLFWQGNFGAVKNDLGVYYQYRNKGGEWSSLQGINYTLNSSDNTYTASGEITGLPYKDAYEVQIVVYDKVYQSGVYSNRITLKLYPVFDWSDTDFNFNVPVSINNVEQDYIVESGTSGIWTYEKWNSGKAICWGMYTLTTAVDSLWESNVYMGSDAMERIDYPFGFVSKPTETVTLQTGNYAAWLYSKAVNGGYASGIYNVCRFGAVSNVATFYLSFQVIGKWK